MFSTLGEGGGTINRILLEALLAMHVFNVSQARVCLAAQIHVDGGIQYFNIHGGRCSTYVNPGFYSRIAKLIKHPSFHECLCHGLVLVVEFNYKEWGLPVTRYLGR